MATISVKLDKRYKNAKGESPIVFFISKHKMRVYISSVSMLGWSYILEMLTKVDAEPKNQNETMVKTPINSRKKSPIVLYFLLKAINKESETGINCNRIKNVCIAMVSGFELFIKP